jgi:hypothetical protein
MPNIPLMDSWVHSVFVDALDIYITGYTGRAYALNVDSRETCHS